MVKYSHPPHRNPLSREHSFKWAAGAIHAVGPPTVLLKTVNSRQSRVGQRDANRRVAGAESSTIVEQTAGKLRKTLFAANSGMTRGGQICIVGPPIPASTRTDVTVGAASRGVISIAVMGLAKPRKTFARVHEARSGKGSVHPRAATMALVTGPLQSRFS